MFLKVSFGVMLLLGVLFALFGVYFIGLGNESGSWPDTQGTIESVTIRTDTDMAGNAGLTVEERERRRRYFPSITYRWEVDGQSYTGSRYQLGTTHEKYAEREQAVAAAAKYRTDTTITVYYDPKDPSQAVLDKSASSALWVPLLLGLLLAGMGGVGLKKFDVIERALATGSAEPLDLP